MAEVTGVLKVPFVLIFVVLGQIVMWVNRRHTLTCGRMFEKEQGKRVPLQFEIMVWIKVVSLYSPSRRNSVLGILIHYLTAVWVLRGIKTNSLPWCEGRRVTPRFKIRVWNKDFGSVGINMLARGLGSFCQNCISLTFFVTEKSKFDNILYTVTCISPCLDVT